jgi:hypothetical protein
MTPEDIDALAGHILDEVERANAPLREHLAAIVARLDAHERQQRDTTAMLQSTHDEVIALKTLAAVRS